MTDGKVEGASTGAPSATSSKAAEKSKPERKITPRKKTTVDFLGREGVEGTDFLGRTI